jgi:hypothetical protein
MIDAIPFRLRLRGGDADHHELPAYDGYMALAGFAWTLSLVTNYAETGKIRHRGAFEGRSSVKAKVISDGSVIADFVANLSQNSGLTAVGVEIGIGLTVNFLYDLLKRTVNRNVGIETAPQTDELKTLERGRGGDLEALAAAVEPSVRQTHSVIDQGVGTINIYGNNNRIINTLNDETKAYVDGSIEDRTILAKNLSVASFNANSGYGSVYDADLGRTVPIKLTKDTLDGSKEVLSWGLHEYAKGTGKKVSLRFFRVLSFDRTPKRYIVVNATIPKN